MKAYVRVEHFRMQVAGTPMLVTVYNRRLVLVVHGRSRSAENSSLKIHCFALIKQKHNIEQR